MSSSIFLASFAVDPTSFFIIFTLGVGIGKGLALPASMKAGWIYLPNRKGLVSGIIMSSFSIGSMLYGTLATVIVNPHNT
jgi:MFS family permease